MRTLNALSVRKKFGGILDEICRNGEPVVITRADRPLVAVIPYQEYRRLSERGDREKRLRRVFKEIREWSNEHEEASKTLNTVEMIREIRQGK